MLIPLRDENPTRSWPFVTIALIVINVLVFIYEFTLGSAQQATFFASFALYPSQIVTGVPLTSVALQPLFLTVITSMFLHGGLLHIAGNMLYLWIFGNNVEDLLGHVKFVLFYLATGVVAAGAHILSDPSSKIPTIGASGAIAGVLGAYIILFPYARVLTAVPIFFYIGLIRLPALALIGFWFVLQLFSGVASLSTQTAQASGVAWFAHIGGFVAGAILILFLPKRRIPKTPGIRSIFSD